jgi:hypothetical protein
MKKNIRNILYIVIPVVYGLLLRLAFNGDDWNELLEVMSLTFFFTVPFGMGILTIVGSPIEKVQSLRYRIFAPWKPLAVLLIVTTVFTMEGFACWIMIMPVFMIFASLGGLIAGYFKLKKFGESNRLQISIAILLPFILAPLEKTINIVPATYKAYTYIDIAAPAPTIWQHVIRVTPIAEQEDQGILTNLLGFPRPIKAELDVAAVGGIRKALFSKGLVFTEEVTDYQPEKHMSFTISANPYEIPSTAMDEHVVIGGKYFDVLDGTYQLQRLSGNVYRLHLYSHFQLKTTFNFYAGWWATWIMKDIQNNILHVIKTRCEK